MITMLQRYHRVFNHHTVTTMLTRSSFQSLTLRPFQTLISPTTILQPQPWSVHTPRPRLKSSMFATAARAFCAPSLNSVPMKPIVSVMDKWEEVNVVVDVSDSIDRNSVLSVRVYHSDISVDVKSLKKKYKPSYFGDSYVVLRFGNAKPGLRAINWSDDISYMVVFDYGSVILLNVREHEISERLEIVKASNRKVLSQYRDLLPENAPVKLTIERHFPPYCFIVFGEDGDSHGFFIDFIM